MDFEMKQIPRGSAHDRILMLSKKRSFYSVIIMDSFFFIKYCIAQKKAIG
ncbi:hypothetical protein D1BOALGB6SA_7340 [Olavius sp. associated proteobacterium Delta 1]|nr:hypothetical protein D1BOALGB6SA_7340 [Olavius sp. associated proteobacterium Delta 1]